MKKKEDLSIRQRQVLDFMKEEIKTKGYPPTIREIGLALHMSSSSTVHNHLKNLEQKGYIRKDPTKPRAIEILDLEDTKEPKAETKPIVSHLSSTPYPETEKELIEVPLVGSIAAGQPILAEENLEDTFPIPTDFVGHGDVFMLKVKGESMVEAGILNGDYVLIRQQNTAQNGEIVAAMIEDEATVKTFYKEKNHIRLQPENSSMEPIIVEENLTILGKVVGLMRKM